MVTRLDSEALQTAPRPQWALGGGGGVPFLTYPHSLLWPLGKAVNRMFPRGDLGSVGRGALSQGFS